MPRKHGARKAEGGGEIDRDDLIPLLVLHAHEEIVAGDAGIVDQDVDAGSCRRFRRLGQTFDGCDIGKIGGRDEGARTQFRFYGFQGLGASAGEDHRRALGMQRLGDGAADAAGGAGDKRGLTCQIKHYSASCESFDFSGRIQRDSLKFLVNAFDHAGEHLVTAQFHRRIHAERFERQDALAPTHPAGDLFHQEPAHRFRLRCFGGRDIGENRDRERADGDVRQCLAHGVGGRLHQRAMERRGYGQGDGALDPLGLGDIGDTVHRLLRSRQHHLARRIVIGDHTDAAPSACFLRHRFGGLDLSPDQGDHRAGAHRHGGLHRLAARLQKPRRIRQG